MNKLTQKQSQITQIINKYIETIKVLEKEESIKEYRHNLKQLDNYEKLLINLQNIKFDEKYNYFYKISNNNNNISDFNNKSICLSDLIGMAISLKFQSKELPIVTYKELEAYSKAVKKAYQNSALYIDDNKIYNSILDDYIYQDPKDYYCITYEDNLQNRENLKNELKLNLHDIAPYIKVENDLLTVSSISSITKIIEYLNSKPRSLRRDYALKAPKVLEKLNLSMSSDKAYQKGLHYE